MTHRFAPGLIVSGIPAAWPALLTAAVLGMALVLFGAGCDRRTGTRDAAGEATESVSGAGRPAEMIDISLADPPVILALGDSLTAGFGVDEAVNYPAQLQNRLTAQGFPHRVVNAGISGDTSAGGLARMDWILRQPIAILIVELGANDGLRGQAPEATRANLARIIERGQQAGAKVVLAGMRMPVTLGWDFKRKFDAIYADLADRYGAHLIPFVLEGVAGRRDLNLPDGIHPNEEGYRIVVDNVWEALEPLLDVR